MLRKHPELYYFRAECIEVIIGIYFMQIYKLTNEVFVDFDFRLCYNSVKIEMIGIKYGELRSRVSLWANCDYLFNQSVAFANF